MIYLLPQIK